jgi:hypothetical protein
MYELVRYFILPLQITKFLRRGTIIYGHLKLNVVMSDWVTPDCAARAVRAMDLTMPPETYSEHLARSKQSGVTQSDSKFKFPFVLKPQCLYNLLHHLFLFPRKFKKD